VAVLFADIPAHLPTPFETALILGLVVAALFTIAAFTVVALKIWARLRASVIFSNLSSQCLRGVLRPRYARLAASAALRMTRGWGILLPPPARPRFMKPCG
jgi:hypothetical protein